MFDEIAAKMAQCAAAFDAGAQDSFGASIIAEVVAPILSEINSLCLLSEEFTQESFALDRMLEEARMILMEWFE